MTQMQTTTKTRTIVAVAIVIGFGLLAAGAINIARDRDNNSNHSIGANISTGSITDTANNTTTEEDEPASNHDCISINSDMEVATKESITYKKTLDSGNEIAADRIETTTYTDECVVAPHTNVSTSSCQSDDDNCLLKQYTCTKNDEVIEVMMNCADYGYDTCTGGACQQAITNNIDNADLAALESADDASFNPDTNTDADINNDASSSLDVNAINMCTEMNQDLNLYEPYTKGTVEYNSEVYESSCMISGEEVTECEADDLNCYLQSYTCGENGSLIPLRIDCVENGFEQCISGACQTKSDVSKVIE